MKLSTILVELRDRGGEGKKLRFSSKANDWEQMASTSGGMNGIAVSNREGQEIAFITNLNSNMTQEQFDALMTRYFTELELEILGDTAEQMQILKGPQLQQAHESGAKTAQYSLKDYISQMKDWLRTNNY